MTHPRRAFTLAESLITLFVVFLVFGVASGLLHEYSSILRFSAAKEKRFSVAQVALKRMVDETREALILESPTGSWSSSLTFQRLDPNYTIWLPGVVLAQPFDPYNTTITTWTPRPPAQMLRMDYSVSAGELVRSLAPVAGGSNTTSVLATGVSGLQVTPLSTGALEITLSVEDSHQVITPLTAQVLRPIP